MVDERDGLVAAPVPLAVNQSWEAPCMCSGSGSWLRPQHQVDCPAAVTFSNLGLAAQSILLLTLMPRQALGITSPHVLTSESWEGPSVFCVM